MADDRLDPLILRHFDGDLSPEEQKALDRTIAEEPGTPEVLADLAAQELFLAEELGHPLPQLPAVIEKAAAAGTPSTARRTALRWTAAAAILLTAGLALWFSRGTPVTPPMYEGQDLFTVNAAGQLTPATELNAGKRYFARTGTLKLKPASISFKAPSLISLPEHAWKTASKRPVILHAGHIHVSTPDNGNGIRICTQQGTLTDIGTEFEVKTTDPMEERAMLSRMRSGALNTFVIATVLSGIVKWESQAGESTTITPAMGAIKLAYDASLGKIVDRDGLAQVKPINGRRWTLATRNAPIEAGDWIKTDALGAHAVEVRLKDGTRLVLGPAGLMELTRENRIRLHRGELEVMPVEETKVNVEGPGSAVKTLTADTVLRAAKGALTVLDKSPRWLIGYKAQSTSEAMGELVASMDDRKLPLTLGYHKVTVDIKDQIARTVVEESFLNHTDQTLEGVFYFPLPADASISGFAMWINGECVEADIVEKERAREIYETILREKRDPGLLEWTGGNIFKARVYPIFGHSEKRIRITYTQVLPKRGDTYRYAYALQSEMLKKTPLRELQLKVTIHSEETLAKVECPTHMTRIQRTEHAASCEFEAQEYTPGRDFELRITTKPAGGKALVIPHLRGGGDGYFMLLLKAPGEEAARPLVQDGKPLNFVLVADTSGSMTDEQLAQQRAFIAGLLSALDKDDTFNLVATDVTAEWAFERAVPATAENAGKALEFIKRRGALGWTDLDLAFGEAAARADPQTHVIYVGDGIPTTDDADPVALMDRLTQAYRGRGIFHAIAVGTTYEHMVLKRIAALGGGSLHTVGAGQDAHQTAQNLLAEITRPGLRNISIGWEGFSAARVYPGTLPNLPAGAQQIILGRYLPQGDTLKGHFSINATLNGEPFTQKVPVSFAGAETGNSFIPRLWARMHLDYLLAQGATPAIKESIIALSEDFQIITPYTSLLVLESDADRERFQVKKRLRMRDGEEFFAKGRNDAAYELARQQMLAALKWRQGLRAAILRQYYRRGRDLMATSLVPQSTRYHGPMTASGVFGVGGGGGWTGGYYKNELRQKSASSRFINGDASFDGESEIDLLGPLGEADFSGFDFSRGGRDFAGGEIEDLELRLESADGLLFGDAMHDDGAMSWYAPSRPNLLMASEEKYVMDMAKSSSGLEPMSLGTVPYGGRGVSSLRRRSSRMAGINVSGYMQAPIPQSSPFYNEIPTPGGPIRPQESLWPKKLQALVDGINRRKSFAGNILITLSIDAIDARQQVTPGMRGRYLISEKQWCTRVESYPGDAPMLNWTWEGKRGICNLSRRIGSRRKAQAGDARAFHSPISYYFDNLAATYASWHPEITSKDGKTVLALTNPVNSGMVDRFTIDTDRRCILELARYVVGKMQWAHRFGDFVQCQGAWWPKTLTYVNGDNKATRSTALTYKALDGGALAAAIKKELSAAADSLILARPLPTVVDAKTAVRDKKASLAHRWVLMNYFATTQRWPEVRTHFDAFAKHATGKAAVAWIRLAVLKASRRNEEARQLLMQLAGRIKDASPGFTAGTFSLAWRLQNDGRSITQAIERLALIQALKPILAAQDERLHPMKTWDDWRLRCLDDLGRGDQALALRKSLVERHPYDTGLHSNYADALVRRGELEQALAHLNKAAAETPDMTGAERYQLRQTAARQLYNQRRLVDFLAYADKWLVTDPKHVGNYDFNRMLSALVMLDREPEADRRIAAWLADAFKDHGKDDDESLQLVLKKLNAALSHALGRGDSLYGGHIEKKWRPVLCRLVNERMEDRAFSSQIRTIITSWQFKRIDEGMALQKTWYGKLLDRVDTLPPASIDLIFNWLSGYTPGEEEPKRTVLDEKLFARWQNATDPGDKAILARVVARTSRRIDLGRAQFAKAGNPRDRGLYAQQLFTLLAAKPWDMAIVRELESLLPHVGHGDTKHAMTIKAIQVYARYLVEAHARHLVDNIPDRNKLDARALRPLVKEKQKQARLEAIAMLAALEKASILDPVYSPFVVIEHLTLGAGLSLNIEEVLHALLDLFTAVPEPEKDAVGLDPATQDLALHRRILCERCMQVACYLAVKHETNPKLMARLMPWVDGLIKDKTGKVEAKRHKYQLLVVIDKPKVIEKLLEKWAREAGDIAGNPWRINYGYILAEQGKLEAAVKEFNQVKRNDELGAAEHKALAGWLMALDNKAAHQEALIGRYNVVSEYQIRRLLDNALNRYRRRGKHIPEELDEEELRRFRALFRKATRPSRYTYILQQYYRETKDFRLLETLPEAIIGQSAAKIYDLLGNLKHVLELIGDEATCDRIQAQLVNERKRAKSAVDLRGLHLLEFLVERRAADQAHGKGPHVAAALTALKAAFKPAWQDGEQELMAKLLASVGRVVPELRRELLGQLAKLHTNAPQGSRERFMIGVHRASALWQNEKAGDAVAVIASALEAYRQTNGGLLPPDGDSPLATYADYLVKSGENKAAEKVWRTALSRGYNAKRKKSFTLKLYDFYARMILHKLPVALGRGETLYRAVRDEILVDTQRHYDDRHMRYLVQKLCKVFRNAHKTDLKEAGPDIRRFGFNTLPGILRRLNYRQGQNMVSDTADPIKTILGLREVMAFLVTRAENEPRWLKKKNEDFWRQHNWRFSQWRKELKDLGDLEPRVLAIVSSALREGLINRRFYGQSMFHDNHSNFWAEKREDFFDVAMAVLDEHGKTEAAVMFIADYLFEGLEKHDAAIEALQAAYSAGRLTRSGEWRLVTYLQRKSRHKDAIKHLEGVGGLVARFPEDVRHHTALMVAYFHVKQPEKRDAAYAAAVAWFKKEKAWHESTIASLAKGCLDTHLHQAAVDHYDEAIALRRKANPLGREDHQLANYYYYLSKAYTGLRKTGKAVDAALGAVLVWSRNRSQRDHTINNLHGILKRAPDLAAFADAFDKACAKNNQEKPLLRKALGSVFLDKKDYSRAIIHLEAYIENGRFDKTVSEQLIQAYDKGGQGEKATTRLLALARASERNYGLYKDLGERLGKAGKRAEAERAFTTMAEMSAHESEGHAMLAQWWEKRERYAEAAVQWAQVSRVRAKEPTGYLGRARCLKRSGKGKEAEELLKKLLGQPWPSRFGDVHGEARKLLK